MGLSCLEFIQLLESVGIFWFVCFVNLGTFFLAIISWNTFSTPPSFSYPSGLQRHECYIICYRLTCPSGSAHFFCYLFLFKLCDFYCSMIWFTDSFFCTLPFILLLSPFIKAFISVVFFGSEIWCFFMLSISLLGF